MHRRVLALFLLSFSTALACGGSGESAAGGAAGAGTGGAGESGGASGTGGSSPGAGTGGGAGVPESSGTGGAPSSNQDAGAAGAGGSGKPDGAVDGGVADDSPKASDAGGTAGDASASGPYTCNLIIGIQTTSEWFGDFEKIADSARWELKSQDSAHIEKWADPNNAVWSLPITSPCATNAMAPDRVVFMGVNYDFATVDLFLPKYIAVLNNIKAKFPSVKRMDVMTYTRAPGDMECTGANRPNDSYIKPAQDEAISMFAAMYPDFVFPAPKWEVKSCADFTLCPHLTGTANATIAKTIAAYFAGP